MPKLAVILKGDKTTHGGTVMEGFEQVTCSNIPVAGVGHRVSCPMCKGTFLITEGTPQIIVNGLALAVEGMKTACGAQLIASQRNFTV